MGRRRSTDKAILTNPFRRGHRRWKVVALAVVAIALLATAHPTPMTVAIGLPLIAAGAALRTWAAGHLLKTRELTMSGPYAYTRNPLYVGTLLIGTGFGVLAGTLVAAIAAPIGLGLFFGYYFPRKERKESALLQELYGDSYRAYHAAVPPFLPRWSAWSPGPAHPVRHWSFQRVRNNGETGTEFTVLLALAVIALLVFWRDEPPLRALGHTDAPVVGELSPALEQPKELVLRR